MTCHHALLTVIVLIVFAGNLTAQTPRANTDNIATEKNGAVVLYSTPLTHGASPNRLLNGHPLTFSKKGTGTHILVIDLGKTYNLDTISLKFSKSIQIKVYVLGSKPDGRTPWTSLVKDNSPKGVLDSSNAPATLTNAIGQYLVFVADQDPGAFFDLNVTGTPFTRHLQVVTGPPQLGSSSLSETPYPASSFQEQASSPQVPPQSR